MTRHLVLWLLLTTCPLGAQAQGGRVPLDLGLKALQEPLQTLSTGDRQVVDTVIGLIKESKHTQAFAYLTTLTTNNPMNSSVRVLRAYVMLELGNLTGALDDAKSAEDSGTHSAYRCWFLAQVAYVAGDKSVCLREIKHLDGSAEYGAQAQQLGRKLNGTK